MRMSPEEQEAYLQRLGVLVKPAGADCNLRCEYCFYRPKALLYPHQKRHAMPLEVLNRFIGDYMQMAGQTPSFGWQGGEPTTLGLEFFRRVVAIQVKKAKPGQAIANGFQTNGILIDDDWARFFRRYQFLVGLSLDGPQHIHDYYRRDLGRRPTWDRVMRAMATLRANAVEFNILCMVTAFSGDKGAEVYDFFKAHDLRFLQFIPCIEIDPDTGNVMPYSCTPQQYGQFLCEVFDRWAAEEPAHTYVRTFDDLLMAYMGEQSPTCIFRPTCAEYLLIEHNGDVYPCDFFVEERWKLGNLMETPLREIALSDKLMEFRYAKSELVERCVECEYVRLCYGGCQRHRFHARQPANLAPGKREALVPVNPGETEPLPGAAPQLDGIYRSNYFCESYRMLFEHSRSRLEEMAQRLKSLRPEHRLPGA